MGYVRVKIWVLGSLYLYLSVVMSSCLNSTSETTGNGIRISSPDGQLTAVFHLKNGIPFYSVSSGNTLLLNDSRLGIRLSNGLAFDKGLALLSAEQANNSLLVILQVLDKPEHELTIAFSLSNDAVRFRYQVAEQTANADLMLVEELTEFAVVNNFDLRWISDSSSMQHRDAVRQSRIIDLNEAVNVPVRMSYCDSFYMTLLEDPMPRNFRPMTLINNGNNTLKVSLPAQSQLVLAQTRNSFSTPWRVIQITAPAEARARLSTE